MGGGGRYVAWTGKTCGTLFTARDWDISRLICLISSQLLIN